VKHGYTLALLTCLDRASRVAYVLLLGSGRFGLCS
jgi:hypothetical protein